MFEKLVVLMYPLLKWSLSCWEIHKDCLYSPNNSNWSRANKCSAVVWKHILCLETTMLKSICLTLSYNKQIWFPENICWPIIYIFLRVDLSYAFLILNKLAWRILPICVIFLHKVSPFPFHWLAPNECRYKFHDG